MPRIKGSAWPYRDSYLPQFKNVPHEMVSVELSKLNVRKIFDAGILSSTQASIEARRSLRTADKHYSAAARRSKMGGSELSYII